MCCSVDVSVVGAVGFGLYGGVGDAQSDAAAYFADHTVDISCIGHDHMYCHRRFCGAQGPDVQMVEAYDSWYGIYALFDFVDMDVARHSVENQPQTVAQE